MIESPPDATPNHAYFPVLIGPDFPVSRDALYQRLRERNVLTRRYFYPLISDFPMYRGLPSAHGANLPVARRAADQVLCLPIYPSLGLDDQQRIIDVVRLAAQGRHLGSSVEGTVPGRGEASMAPAQVTNLVLPEAA